MTHTFMWSISAAQVNIFEMTGFLIQYINELTEK